ncbi:nucleotide-binding protein [Desulfurivibrio sp. D14AmB]|uniref:nucleotide-binding protein n=1 Tax=Desulfurivibrio sp. D14AmB TaxID=3374370 RepID=UPI00376F086F
MKILAPRQTAIAAVALASLLLAGCGDSQQQTETPASEASFSSAMQDAHSGMMLDEIPLGSAKAVTPFVDLEVEKATGENSYQVGEVFARGAELDGKTIRVRGQVVKFSPAIMNRNFIHLQDGSGDPAETTHNLVATSDATVEPGNIITIEGVLAANKDFGSGYVYRVILEESRVIE